MASARDARPAGDTSRRWEEDYERLSSADPAALSPDDLDALADAAFWRSREAEAVAARRRAYAGRLKAGDHRAAARAAWWLFYAGVNMGEQAAAAGWLGRAQRHLEGRPECAEHGYVAFAEAELALRRGELAEAERRAARAVALGERLEDANVTAMGLQLQGRALIGLGRPAEGLPLLDEAMCLVLAGQLTDLLTGIVYCVVIIACRDLADLGRAREWTDAARAWCESLPSLTFFHGMCRVYRGEVLGLQGLWEHAEAELRTACGELLQCMAAAAGEAFHALGELQRRRGDLVAAEEAFGRARELGADAQPGLSLLRLAQGRGEAAAAALRTALAPGTRSRVERARLRAAQAEVALEAGDLDTAAEAVEELAAIADELDSAAVRAAAAAARGALRLAEGAPAAALADLRRAVEGSRALGLTYEEARARAALGHAMRALGDEENGRREVQSARDALARLGAVAEARRAAERPGVAEPVPGGLTPREVEVLRLVAAGRSNREIAQALVISEHTVARHLQNMFAKLGLSSRTAASAFAFEHGLV